MFEVSGVKTELVGPDGAPSNMSDSALKRRSESSGRLVATRLKTRQKYESINVFVI